MRTTETFEQHLRKSNLSENTIHSYFAKLKTLDFDQLWTDYLQPLLQEYIQGMYDEEGIMNRFARAYGYQKPARGDANEAAQDQG